MAGTFDRNSCVAWANIPGYDGPYGYDPCLAAGIAFCVLFGTSMLLHTFESVRTRTWWQIVFAAGALSKSSPLPFKYTVSSAALVLTPSPAEVIGWAGRTWSSPCPYQTTPFLIQIVTLIIGKPPPPSFPRVPLLRPLRKTSLTPSSTRLLHSRNLRNPRPPDPNPRTARLAHSTEHLPLHFLHSRHPLPRNPGGGWCPGCGRICANSARFHDHRDAHHGRGDRLPALLCPGLLCFLSGRY